MGSSTVTLLLCGDVMLGRGVDQVLPHPGDPVLREPYIGDAREYVRRAEAANGPIPYPVGFDWPWGDALALLDDARPDVRMLNLETSVTTAGDFDPGKSIHYRMHPANLPSLGVVRPDVCVLANNHVLDFGRRGLLETLDTLQGAGLRTVGAGRDADEAVRPAVVPVEAAGTRVVALAYGTPSSGVPDGWAAGVHTPGVDFMADTTGDAAQRVLERVARVRTPGDVVVVSLHWGSNWGHDIERAQTSFARRLVDGGVDVVYGHSSHHPRALHVHGDKLILYGCGDCVDDYEGIAGYEYYRDELRVLYLATVRPGGGLAELRMVPMRARRMRLGHADRDDAEWLAATLSRVSRRFGCAVAVDAEGDLALKG
ncbi:CapA family protein [Yinghuangia seranimata]|uniref:CapA family protein n=1 Tax=Yinghuangia seranimata TaxID=408067 RepID=UPI00248D3297|nr:CapA family protein [Yinghuangia seranimata]MDI2127647.1 CapA family protein [Yinghuangia seranimata]